jgi:hypothetical protein
MLLQVLRLEMDSQQRRILVLQESVQQLTSGFDSPDNSSMLEKVEMLQDRWDALIQIMEVQGQRVRIILQVTMLRTELCMFSSICCHVN